jgi:hypothetical protein
MADDTQIMTLRDKIGVEGNVAKTAMFGTIVLDATVEVAAAASADSVYTVARVPTSARIHGLSRVQIDDLASTGSPTLDAGFAPVGANFAANDDVLTDGIDAATAGTYTLIKDIANHGKTVWEFLGLGEDPGGLADVTITLKDAATNTGGTMSVSLVYSTNA